MSNATGTRVHRSHLPLVAAATGATPSRRPVWFMRQAGRSLPEYRAIRADHGMLESCFDAELVCEITMQPVRRHDVDAAILFSDIVVPLKAAGIDLDIVAGTGPVIAEPVRSPDAVSRIPRLEPAAVGSIARAIELLLGELGDQVALIGFAGAPFTLASYLIEGGKSAHFVKTKRLMYQEPETWNLLMSKLSEVVRRYLRAQITAGAQCVQLFDSWVGQLGPDDYREYILPHVQHILKDVEKTGVPVIHFGTGTTTLLPLQKEAGGTVIGIDWRLPMDDARKLLGHDVALQGNLDPTTLFAPPHVFESRAKDILQRMKGEPGHIFNLGHGILPETPVDHVQRLIEYVHETSAR